MDWLAIIIALILVGALLYVVGILPIDGTVKTIIKVVAIVALVIWLLQAFAPALRLG